MSIATDVTYSVPLYSAPHVTLAICVETASCPRSIFKGIKGAAVVFASTATNAAAAPLIPLKMLRGQLAVSTQIANVCVGMAAYAVSFFKGIKGAAVVFASTATNAASNTTLETNGRITHTLSLPQVGKRKAFGTKSMFWALVCSFWLSRLNWSQMPCACRPEEDSGWRDGNFNTM
jgi:hypothetical protein